jgi:hypothetical protein
MKVKNYRFGPSAPAGSLATARIRASERAGGESMRRGNRAPKRIFAVLTLLATVYATCPVSLGNESALRDGQHDFDFLVGRWKVHLKRRASGSDHWVEFDGYGIYRTVWDGRANFNEFETDSPTGHIEGLTIRTYNPKSHQWSLYWANSQDGVLGSAQVGEFHDGVGEFYAWDSIDGRSTLIRYVWSKITAHSAHFEQAFSGDGGKTWDINWLSDMERVGDSPALSVDPAKDLVAAPIEGQHGFDPLLGHWRFALKRRLNPLTGSNRWVNFTGFGDCEALWNGRAQLETVSMDSPGGHLDGLTLRLFNPKTREWREYWANANDGLIAAPQIGEFKNGHGNFYAQDTLDDKSILVRYHWYPMNNENPHFEQSYSNDGGKSWEVNWVTEQSRSR